MAFSIATNDSPVNLPAARRRPKLDPRPSGGGSEVVQVDAGQFRIVERSPAAFRRLRRFIVTTGGTQFDSEPREFSIGRLVSPNPTEFVRCASGICH